MAVSKVVFAGETIIDLTGDTVDAEHMLDGYTAHGKDGSLITGSCTFDSDTSDATAVASEILDSKTAYIRGAKVTGSMTNVGAFTSDITLKTDQISIPIGFHDGSGKVKLAAAEIDKIVATNIRQGVVILGVEGTMTGTEDVNAESRNVTPSNVEQVIIPDAAAGYNYLSQVTVAPIPYVVTDNAAGGQTVTIG